MLYARIIYDGDLVVLLDRSWDSLIECTDAGVVLLAFPCAI